MKKMKECKKKWNLGKDNDTDRHRNDNSSNSSTSLVASKCDLLQERHNHGRKLLEEIKSVSDNEIGCYLERLSFHWHGMHAGKRLFWKSAVQSHIECWVLLPEKENCNITDYCLWESCSKMS